jgi:hypothetical protein
MSEDKPAWEAKGEMSKNKKEGCHCNLLETREKAGGRIG